jgi:hypothetical protein
MKCIVCQTDNKDTSKVCRKCGTDLAIEPLWRPTWKWHLRVLAIIYVVLIAAYFAISTFLSRIPQPYRMRQVPKELTPWQKS